MTFRIDGALVTVLAIAFLCTVAASAKADTAAAGGRDQAVSATHSHQAHVRRQVHKYTTASPGAELPRPPWAWGWPPLQDRRDAYQGYFANPVDNPRYYGTGRATFIFR